MLHPGHARKKPREEPRDFLSRGRGAAAAAEAKAKGEVRGGRGLVNPTVGQNLEAPFSDVSSAKLADKDLPVEKIEIEQTM